MITTKQEVAKHTPGPWSYSGISGDFSVMARHGHKRIIVAECVADSALKPDECDQVDANKRLIAAAPELLDACRMALVQIKQDNEERKAEHRLTQHQIEAAIQKAEGRQ